MEWSPPATCCCVSASDSGLFSTAEDPADIAGRHLITILIRIIGTCANRRRDEVGFFHLRV